MKPSRLILVLASWRSPSAAVLAALVAGAGWCLPACAEIYGWTDASGVTTYSLSLIHI